METSTQEEASKEGRKITRYIDKLVQDARENVESPSNFCRKRRGPERYTRYMALMIEIVEDDPSSFEEEVEKFV